MHGEFDWNKRSPKLKIRIRNFIVWNSEIIGFDFTEKSLYFTEKHIKKKERKEQQSFLTLYFILFQIFPQGNVNKTSRKHTYIILTPLNPTFIQ